MIHITQALAFATEAAREFSPGGKHADKIDYKQMLAAMGCQLTLERINAEFSARKKHAQACTCACVSARATERERESERARASAREWHPSPRIRLTAHTRRQPVGPPSTATPSKTHTTWRIGSLTAKARC